MRGQEERVQARGDGSERRGSLARYGIFALGVVPLYTLLFACQGNLISTNLSQLGNRPGHHGRFILWGMLCATFFFAFFTRVFEMARYDGWIGRGMLFGACAAFLVCVLVPFVPDRYPRAAQWHNDLAMLATVLTAMDTLVLSLHLRKVDARLCAQSVLLWLLNTGLCMHLLRATGISGLVEVAFIATTCLHVYRVMANLHRLQAVEQEPDAAMGAQGIEEC